MANRWCIIGLPAPACGVSPAWLLALDEGDGPGRGFAEGDVAAYEAPQPTLAVKTPLHHGRWTATSRVLDLVGVLPGDVLEFELGTPPRAGDIVVAQVYDSEAAAAKTVIRLYQPPVLITHSTDPNLGNRPLLIDAAEVRVKIMVG